MWWWRERIIDSRSPNSVSITISPFANIVFRFPQQDSRDFLTIVISDVFHHVCLYADRPESVIYFKSVSWVGLVQQPCRSLKPSQNGYANRKRVCAFIRRSKRNVGMWIRKNESSISRNWHKRLAAFNDSDLVTRIRNREYRRIFHGEYGKLFRCGVEYPRH